MSADYLHWWIKGDRVPVLVTSSPDGTDRADAGVLGLSTTTAIFGGERVSDAGRPGVRLSLGRWIDDCASRAIGAELFWLGEDPERFSRFSQGDPALARPYFNTDPGVNAEYAELVAFDDPVFGDILDGRVDVDTYSDIYSAAVHLHQLLALGVSHGCGYRIDVFGGYRLFRLDESLRVTEALLVTEVGGAVLQGTTFDIFDEFDTSNEFHGGEIGFNSRLFFGRWSAGLLAKAALGGVHQKVRINGQTTVTVPGMAATTSTGGLLAQSTNIGEFTNDEFAVIPEAQFNLAYHFNEIWSARIGYTLLYLTEAARPGPQIDRRVDGRFLDPMAPPFVPTNPVLDFFSSGLWMQGLNVGVEAVY